MKLHSVGKKKNIDIGGIGKTRKYYIILGQKENIIGSLSHVILASLFYIIWIGMKLCKAKKLEKESWEGSR